MKEHQEVRIPLITRLKDEGWVDDQILWSPEWRVPKNPSEASKREAGRRFDGFPVDVALFDDPANAGNYQHIVAIAETKAPSYQAGVNQLQIYMGLEPYARLGIWTNGTESAFVYRSADGSFIVKRNEAKLPGPRDPLSLGAPKKLVFKDLTTPNSRDLKWKFKRLLEIVVARDTVSTRSDERLNQVCNLLLTKLWSDELGEAAPKRPVAFQPWDTEQDTVSAIENVFATQQLAHRDLFPTTSDKKIGLDPHTIHDAAYELAALRLKDVPMHVFSEAFQVFRTASLKTDEGQYFTPYPVIRSAVRAMDIDPSDIVIDPACGTGGFALECYRQLLEFKKQTPDRARQWARRHLYAVDKDRINVKLTKALMLIIGDGSTHTYLGDTLRKNVWSSAYPQLATNLAEETFTAVITNPPFGKNLRLSGRDAKLAGLSIAAVPSDRRSTDTEFSPHEYEERELGILFLERCYRLLVVGGRLGIVLPETYMFSPSYAWLQSWLKPRMVLKAMLNIPMEAFQGFCRAKTNFYIFQKIATI